MFSRRLSSLTSSLRTSRQVSGITIYPLDTFLQPREEPMITLLRLGVQQLSTQQKPYMVQAMEFIWPTWSHVLSGGYYPELYFEMVDHYSNPQSWTFCDPGAKTALKAIRAAGIKVGAVSHHPGLTSIILEELDLNFDALISDKVDAAKEMEVFFEGKEIDVKILSVISPVKILGAPLEDPMNVIWGKDVKTLAEVAALAGVIV